MVESKTEKASNTKKSVPAYSKEALLVSKMFTPVEKNIMKLELEDRKTYTIAQVNKVITNFKGGI